MGIHEAAKQAWQDSQDDFPASYSSQEYFIAGYMAAMPDVADSDTGMTLTEYLRDRHPTVNALTAAEAKILGIKYPLSKGWVESKSNMFIPSNIVSQLRTARKERQAFNLRAVYIKKSRTAKRGQ